MAFMAGESLLFFIRAELLNRELGLRISFPEEPLPLLGQEY